MRKARGSRPDMGIVERNRNTAAAVSAKKIQSLKTTESTSSP